MKDFAGKNAFVTGAASGIGRGLCRTLARAGANVFLADIQAGPLEDARAEIAALGVRTAAVTLDVSDRAAYAAVAREVEAFGDLHLLFNNAGVSTRPKPVTEVTDDEWDWLLGVNLHGVVNGVRMLLPLLQRHGGPAHVVNTASIGGLQVNAGRGTGGYAASKFAVVAYSEALQQELADGPIGVSVLCPAAVDTGIYQSPSVRPARFGGPFQGLTTDESSRMLPGALHPDIVGRRVLEAIGQGELYIFTHLATRDWLLARHRRIIAGYDAIDQASAPPAGAASKTGGIL